MSIKLKFLLFVLVFVCGIGIFKTDLAAASAEISETKLNYFASESGLLNLDASFKLRNPTTDGIVSEFKMEVPYKECKLTNVSVSGRQQVASVRETENGCSVQINFDGNPLKPKEQVWIEFSAEFDASLNRGESSFMLLSNPFTNQETELRVSFESDVPSYVSAIAKETSETELIFETNTSVLIGFGKSYSLGVGSMYEISNTDSAAKVVLQSLPIEDPSQSVEYESIKAAIRAYLDPLGNYYAAISVEEQSKSEVGFSAVVTKNIDTDSNSEGFDLVPSKNLPEMYKNFSDSPLDLQSAYNVFLENSVAVQSQSEITNVWEGSEKGSLDMAIAFSEVLGHYNIRSEIRFGYVIGTDGGSFIPHFWIRANIEDEIYTIDPYLGDLTNTSYFSKTNEFDRISFGTYKPLQPSLNQALGLISYTNHKTLPVLELRSVSVSENETSIEINIPNNVTLYSGFYSTVPIKITSSSNKIERIGSISVDGARTTYKPLNERASDLEAALLPNSESSIPIEFRTNNFFEKGLSSVEIELQLVDSEERFVSEEVVEFEVDVRTIWGIIISFNVVLFTGSYGLYSILKKSG